MKLIHEGNDAAAVGSAAQKRTSLFGDAILCMQMNGCAHRLACPLSPVGDTSFIAFKIREVPIPPLAHLAVLVNQAGGRCELFNASVNSYGVWDDRKDQKL